MTTKYACDKCDQEFMTEKEALEHRNQNHKNKIYKNTFKKTEQSSKTTILTDKKTGKAKPF